jgi:hypothetical protein
MGSDGIKNKIEKNKTLHKNSKAQKTKFLVVQLVLIKQRG